MARRTQRNFDAQIAAVRHLSVPNRWEQGNYEITEFTVEDWDTVVFVKRIKQPLHAKSICYHEAFKVGLRGKVTTIYSTLY